MGIETQKKYKLAGLCIKCGKVPSASGKNYCEPCRERNNFLVRERANKKIASGRCCRCGKNELVNKRMCAKCYQKHRNSAKKSYLVLRDELFEAYGGYICKCCGETERAFLTIDHIDGGGHKHRQQVGQSNIYRWLQQNNYPSGFQVLCMNCQWGKRNCGVCPHQSKNSQLFAEGRKEVRR